MKVLVTGCQGAMGSYMGEYLRSVDPNMKIWGIGRRSEKGHWKFNLKVLDLLDDKKLSNFICEHTFDQIYHFASNPDVALSFFHPKEFLHNNILSTANLFGAVHEHSKNTRIILASTSEVYGTCLNGQPIDEEAPLSPANPYAVSKTCQDLLGRMYVESVGMDIVRIRMFSYFNPRRANIVASMFARKIAHIERNGGILTHGNLASMRTFVDIDDACKAYWLAGKHGQIGEAYNVGSTEPVSIGEILTAMMKQATCPIEAQLDEHLLRPTDPIAQIPIVTKFHKDTHWEPTVPMDVSIMKTLNYWRKKFDEGSLYHDAYK